jgi:hypothetical protein
MISPEYDFEQFVEASKKKDVYEIIYLAEQEAIGAWRRSYRSTGSADDSDQKSVEYQNKLKNLIYHMRSSVRQTKTKYPFNFKDKNN